MNAPAQELVITPYVTQDDLIIHAHRGVSDRLVLCFTGIGTDPAKVPGVEFARTATADGRDNVLFIIDPNRTWLNGDGLIEQIVEHAQRFAQQVGAKEMVTLGHSMGGYSALLMAKFLPVKSAVGLAPQYSVHPDVAADDPRWMDYREQIETHHIRGLGDYLTEETTYHVFHGTHGRERAQRDRFPKFPTLYHMIMPQTVHNVPQRMKRFGIMDQIIQLSFENKVRQVRLLMADKMGAFRRDMKKYPALAPSSEVSS
ncbi:alpha/beta hydrolase [Thalassobius sp. Cn5-15]|uniref:alpha/beta hydrolase n=1 Tax=Thalassobius sp. Cn5-15 TaxID=2917763 RepID=UPI001EF19D0B|nr:alpha/beta hydrolase [Thalassobius sp. Cn5-15]MCG7495105.1 alpha/beta hydrolase [Thalassobius sp. Cn5-15]